MSVSRQSDTPRSGSAINLVCWQAADTNAKIGAHSAGETPVPIPNTAVKPSSGYNTWPIKAWENSTVPIYKNDLLNGGLFLYFSLLFSQCGKYRGPHKTCFVGCCHGADL